MSGYEIGIMIVGDLINKSRLDGGENFFFGHIKICIGEKFTFNVYFKIKKSLGHFSQFPIPRSTFSDPPFRGCHAPPKQRPNL